MGKEEILNYLINSKINETKLRELCYYFCKDFTATQTAQKINISRQTINNYYKIIRSLLFQNQNELLHLTKSSDFAKNSFCIKYIKSNLGISYFLEQYKKVFLLDENSKFVRDFKNFANKHLDKLLISNKKANCAQVLYNKKENKFLITKLYKTENNPGQFILKRLKKFRGVSKQMTLLHLKESQFRYNHSFEYQYKTLLNLLNLNYKTNSF